MQRLGILFVLFLTFVCCSSNQKLLEEAKSNDTIDAYNHYLKKYPNSEDSSFAKSRIEQLEFEKVVKIDSIQNYTEYLDKYPNSTYFDSVMTNLIYLEYQGIKKSGKYDAYNTFKRKYYKYCSDDIKKDVDQKLEEIFWAETLKKNTIEAYANYVKKFPNKREQSEVEEKISRCFADILLEAKEKGKKTHYMAALPQVVRVGTGSEFTLSGGRTKLGDIEFLCDPFNPLEVYGNFSGYLDIGFFQSGRGIAFYKNEIYIYGLTLPKKGTD